MNYKETAEEIRSFGVAHTPIEIARFAVGSAVSILQKKGTKEINALDAFTGDGVFISALLECGVKNITAYEIRERMALLTARKFDGLARVVCADAFKSRDSSFNLFVGNPPYGKCAGNNEIDRRIKETYCSRQKNYSALFDAYVRAVRWASDCLEHGVIAYVINNGFLDNLSFDGFRKSLEKEFDEIYIFNLRGNHRTSGERCKKEGENVFAQECRTGIAIIVLYKE